MSIFLRRIYDPIWRYRMSQNILRKIFDAEAKNCLSEEEKKEVVKELASLNHVAKATPWLLYPLTRGDIDRAYTRLKGVWGIGDPEPVVET